MSLFLSHDSSLRYWLTKTGDEAVPDVAPVCDLERASASSRELGTSFLPVDYSAENPVHVLVSDPACLHSSSMLIPHLWTGPLPVGAFNELSGANYVSSPEFTILQTSAKRSFLESLEVGLYLCGTFSIGDEGRGYVGGRRCLTTPEALASFLGRCTGAYGAKKARASLRYVLARAASPMEVLLILAFTLPPRLGGWGFPEIVPNEQIAVDEHLRGVAGTGYFVGDIYIPSVRGDVEFDSEEFHTGRWRADHTQARRNVLEVMGIKTMSATWRQINTFEKFKTFIWMVKERFGLPHRDYTPEETVAQISLYEQLTDFRRKLF